MIKRFFHDLLIKDNIRIVRKRFVNVDPYIILKAMKRLLLRYFNIKDSDKLAVYLVQILGMRMRGSVKGDSQALKEADDFRILSNSFSKKGYKRIQYSFYFQTIVNLISQREMPDSGMMILDYIFLNEARYIKKEEDKYMGVFTELIENCKKLAELNNQ